MSSEHKKLCEEIFEGSAPGADQSAEGGEAKHSEVLIRETEQKGHYFEEPSIFRSHGVSSEGYPA